MKTGMKIVCANWKLNPPSLKEARSIFDGIKGKASSLKSTQVIICPSPLHLPILRESYRGRKISFGSQDVFWEEKGSFTGEISPLHLRDLKVEYTIIGHSERRRLGEGDEDVVKKVNAALRAERFVILCVGEEKRGNDGAFLSFIARELKTAFENIPLKYRKNIIVAYEPLWAIGKSADEAMNPHQMHQMSLYIRKVLTELFGKKRASDTPILYGGSVEASNAESLIKDGEIDGFLIGHASLVPEEFNSILDIVEKS